MLMLLWYTMEEIPRLEEGAAAAEGDVGEVGEAW